MKLVLLRNPSVAGATVGRLYIDGIFACHTLEDEVREIPGRPVAEWKIQGATAIPAGRYRVTLENSPRFGWQTPTLQDVPGFTHIRMHAGNSAADTEGCILLGMRATERSLIAGTSRPAVALVRGQISAAIERGEDVWIDIQNPVMAA
jgi:hypothetical protein